MKFIIICNIETTVNCLLSGSIHVASYEQFTTNTTVSTLILMVEVKDVAVEYLYVARVNAERFRVLET